jgi:tRNA nucleotidyltransferase (CCA-adding enzyme)
VKEQLKQVLGNDSIALLQAIGAEAFAQSIPAYVIGGTVRDVLLKCDFSDLDLMIEGDAISFAKKLKEDWRKILPYFCAPAKFISFKRYGTAKLNFTSPVISTLTELDFASARRESYPKPAEAPVVEKGTLKEDLARRDFSINAMAVSLSPDSFGKLIDLFDGAEDLKNKVLRVLHPNSFVDDPARLIRAMRFAGRFGFKLGESDRKLFEEAIDKKYLKLLPPRRLFEELKKAFSDREAINVISALEQSKILKQVFGDLDFLQAIELASKNLARLSNFIQWEIVIASLTHKLADEQVKELLNSLAATKEEISSLMLCRASL